MGKGSTERIRGRKKEGEGTSLEEEMAPKHYIFEHERKVMEAKRLVRKHMWNVVSNVFMKVHARGKETIVAICDRDLVGRVLREGEVVIDLDKYRGFYKGEKVGKKEAVMAVKACTSANFVGEKATEIAVMAGMAKREDFGFVEGVPHLQFYRLSGKG